MADPRALRYNQFDADLPDPASLDSEEALREELSKEEYGEWVLGIMRAGNKDPYWVWNTEKLAQILAKDDPKRWACLKAGVTSKYGWAGFCELQKELLVWTGKDENETEYIHHRRHFDDDVAIVVECPSEFKHEVPWYCWICYYTFSCLGTCVQYIWCCWGFVIPNWFCVWRWPCLQAPSGCAGRSYWDFDEIEPEIGTGDIFVFCGSNLTRLGGQSHWSHVGICFRDEEGLTGPKGLLYVFEANFGQAGWDHCDIRILREKIKTYKHGTTDAAWRPLRDDLDDIDEKRRAIGQAILDLRGVRYDHDLEHMFLAAADFAPCFDFHEDKEINAMFCSEAVAHVLQVARVLKRPPDGPPAAEYLPRDFGTRMCAGNDEHRCASEVLSDEIYMIQRTDPTKWTVLSLH